MIRQIPKNNISKSVFNEMMDLIATGTWGIGNKIPSEHELSDQFNVSRNSVRFAIQRLSALGLLEAKQGEGTFIKRLDTSFYMNLIIPSVFLGDSSPVTLLEFQRALQEECVKLACIRRTEGQMEQLRAYVDLMKANLDDHEEFLRNDISYHVLLSEMTFNELFIKSMQILRVMLFHSLKSIVDNHDSNISINAHTKIADAIQARDKDLASRLMNEHMEDVMATLIALEHTKKA